MEPEHSSLLLARTPAVEPDPRLHDVRTTEADPELPPDRRRLICLRLHWETARDDAPFTDPAGVLQALARDDVPWTRDDLIWSLRVLATETGRDDGAPWRLPALIGAALPTEDLRDLQPAIETVLDALKTGYLRVRVRHSLSQAYGAVLDRIDEHGADEILGLTVSGPGVRAVLRHAETLAKPVPPRAWLQRADTLLAAAPGAAEAIAALLERFRTSGEAVTDETDTVLRGLIWCAARDPGAEVTRLLARSAVAAGDSERCALKTANAVVEALADRPSDATLQALARLMQSARSKPLLTRVRAALERLGVSPGDARELAVDDHGLGADGRRSRPLSDADVVIVEIHEGKARLQVLRNGKPLRRVPAEVDVAEARTLVKDINKSLSAERERLESLMSEDRTWAGAEWVTRYLDHPITGVLARSLIWQTSAEGRPWQAGIPRRGPDGGWSLVTDPAASRVRLWHPALATPEEVAHWRDHISAVSLRQPFKQAFREVYPLTPAEVAGRNASQRFAGHILRYRQAAALMRTRGWSASYLGAWDQGHRTEATKDLGGGDWRARLAHEVAGEVAAPHYQVLHCATGEVRFAHHVRGAWQDVPLGEVPPLVFSEAMRDVDLFVGVTSIAADEAWQERGADRFPAYRESAGFGELTASAEVRRDVLARLLPRLSIGPRCELSGRFLRVRGHLGTYRIHLGSANILIEPNDTYLCIVPDWKKKPAIQLPFDDDRVLSLILSKAILLAADDKITDPMIVPQLPGRSAPVGVPVGAIAAEPDRPSGAAMPEVGVAGAGRWSDRVRTWLARR